jgi:hypothetical protein
VTSRWLFDKLGVIQKRFLLKIATPNGKCRRTVFFILGIGNNVYGKQKRPPYLRVEKMLALIHPKNRYTLIRIK